MRVNTGLFLFVKVLFVCLKLSFASNASLPPRLDEAATITHQLGECGKNRQQAYAEAAVVKAGIYEDESRIKNERYQGCNTEHVA